jgi:hypothetical protein
MNIDIEETLIEAFKNAAERGVPSHKIKESFINAGYDKEKVDSAYDKIKEYLPKDETISEDDLAVQEPTIKMERKDSPVIQPRIIIPQKKQKRSNTLLIAVIILFLLILAVAGGILFWLYKDSIMSLLS